MARTRPIRLASPVDGNRDHVLGNLDVELTLVEYGSYACGQCHVVHEVIAGLRRRFGGGMRYVFRHRPVVDNDAAQRAAVLAEYASETTGQFWPVHEALMARDPKLTSKDFEEIAEEFDLPPSDGSRASAMGAAELRVQEDIRSAEHSGALVTPTFFINDRRYEGPWDEDSLSDALIGSLGRRLYLATSDFVGWGPSAGLLLLFMAVAAVVLTNSALGPSFESWLEAPLGVQFGDSALTMSLVDWINHGLLSVFFLVVGLEIKREFTVGHLATRQSAALPIVAALGGIVLPAVIYLALCPPGPLRAGWGVCIATDTAFAVALIVLLGDRVPVELRVFLTAAVIIDDLVAIAVIALFYTSAISVGYLIASFVVTGLLVALNRWAVYRPLPYAILGAMLWICLHHAGLHATLSGVILAIVTPTRPPANLRALMTQAEIVIQAETKRTNGAVTQRSPSPLAMKALDAIHDRMESPADKLLRLIEPWSSYLVLPLFALANAGVVWSLDVFADHGRLMLALAVGLVVGKPIGIVTAAWLAVRLGIAVKPGAYSWRQLCGAGVLAGIGFTMSLFIASEAFPQPADYAAAKIAIFVASFIAGALGAIILYPRGEKNKRRQSAQTASPAAAGVACAPNLRCEPFRGADGCISPAWAYDAGTVLALWPRSRRACRPPGHSRHDRFGLWSVTL